MSQEPNKLQVSGLSVPFTLSATYLGVTLDSKLTWNIHFNNQITKCKKYLHMLQKGVKNPRGLNPPISDGFTQLLYSSNLSMLFCPGDIAHDLLTNILHLIN